MINKAYDLLELVKSVLAAFRDTDFSQVNFGSLGLALGAGFFLLALFLYKILWGRNKFRHFYSGHEIPVEYDESTITRRLICAFPKLLLAGLAIFLLTALANPYLPRTKIETIIESRERIELIDVSASMGWPFGNTGKSACEATREVHLKFLKMRRGQNDRVTLWLFSNNAYKVEDFITDDEIYMLQVEDAPCIMVTKGHPSLPGNDPYNSYIDIVVPEDLIKRIDSEGATKLAVGLQAVIKYFDQESKRNTRRKSLLIVSDFAVEEDPEKEFQELKKRKIIPYVIHIKPNELGEKQFNRPDPIGVANELKSKIRRYGGKVFDVEDRRSAERAYAEINKLETAPINIIRHLLKVLIFQRPLMVAVILAMLALLSGIIVARFFEAFP